jgi:hypothetical protein
METRRGNTEFVRLTSKAIARLRSKESSCYIEVLDNHERGFGNAKPLMGIAIDVRRKLITRNKELAQKK